MYGWIFTNLLGRVSADYSEAYHWGEGDTTAAENCMFVVWMCTVKAVSIEDSAFVCMLKTRERDRELSCSFCLGLCLWPCLRSDLPPVLLWVPPIQTLQDHGISTFFKQTTDLWFSSHHWLYDDLHTQHPALSSNLPKLCWIPRACQRWSNLYDILMATGMRRISLDAAM